MNNTKSIVQKDIIPNSGCTPYVTASANDNGVMTYIRCPDAWLEKGNCIMIGGKTLTFTYQENDFCSNDSHNIAVYLKERRYATRKIYLFFISALRAALSYKYSWGNSISMKKIKNEYLYLPVTENDKIDYSFMTSTIAELEAERVAELEAYLEVTGLKDYKLTQKEECLLQGGNSPVHWQEFKFREIFNQIKQGRRLKKEDQVKGNIPFVMAGVTNNGVANYISNPVACFPKNSITIDIFGNTFYRNYDFGAGDDTGVYWNTQRNYAMETMLYFATVMRKTVADKFSYGHKLRSSQSLDFIMKLPITRNGKIDYEYMETYISAVQKVIIADVVQYADKKIAAAKQIINSN